MNASNQQTIWESKFWVNTFFMDKYLKCTLPAICGFMQETAANHADTIGFGYNDMLKTGKLWVMSRMKMKLNHYPDWKDEITIQTWINDKTDKFFSYRDFSFYHKDNQPFAVATISWALIDVQRHRPQPLQEFVQSTGLPISQYAMESLPDKLPVCENITKNQKRIVRYSAIDLLNHMNNIKYVEWMVDAFDTAHHEKYEICGIETNYLAEAHFDDEITIQTQQNANGTTLHTLLREKDNTVICRILLDWKEK